MPTSHVAASAVVGADTRLGHFCVIEEDVVVGSGCELGHHVTIRRGTRIGDNVRIDDGTSVGKLPMRSPNSAVTSEGSIPPATIGNGCLIGANVVLYAGCALGRRVLVADLATVREDVSIGSFTIVGRGVCIENRCTVGRYCKLETNAYVTAYSTIEDRVFVAPGALTSNDNFIGRTEERFKHFKGATIRKGGRVGVGAVLLPGIEVSEDAVVAAGAVLTRNARPGKIYAGIPARFFGDVPDEQKLPSQGWSDEPE